MNTLNIFDGGLLPRFKFYESILLISIILYEIYIHLNLVWKTVNDTTIL